MRKRDTFIQAPLVDWKRLQYFGHVYMGDNKQKFTLLFDTGSSWTWIPSKYFTELNPHLPKEQQTPSTSPLNFSNKFDNDKSLTYSSDGNIQSIQYGKGYIEGWLSQDFIAFLDNHESLESKQQKNFFQFMNVFYAHDLTTLKGDGMMGLSAGVIGGNAGSAKEKNSWGKKG